MDETQISYLFLRQQSWIRSDSTLVNDIPVRTVIIRDFYDFQTRIYSEVFSKADLRWNTLQVLQVTDYPDLPKSSSRDKDLIQGKTNAIIEKMLDYAAVVLA